MTKEVKSWWEYNSEYYQKESKIPIDIHYGPRSPNEKSLKLLGNLKRKKVLEIGCGGAQCGIAMAKKGAIVTGIDISEKQLELAKKLSEKNKVKIKFILGTYQDLSKIKSESMDVVFSAFALQYSPNLEKVFKQICRILKKRGLFVFSLDHPFFGIVDSKTLKLKESYFHSGKKVFTFSDPSKKFICYFHTISDLYNPLVKVGFKVEKIIEPDSRKSYSYDPWHNLWEFTPKLTKMIPPTIIFKARKIT